MSQISQNWRQGTCPNLGSLGGLGQKGGDDGDEQLGGKDAQVVNHRLGLNRDGRLSLHPFSTEDSRLFSQTWGMLPDHVKHQPEERRPSQFPFASVQCMIALLLSLYQRHQDFPKPLLEFFSRGRVIAWFSRARWIARMCRVVLFFRGDRFFLLMVLLYQGTFLSSSFFDFCLIFLSCHLWALSAPKPSVRPGSPRLRRSGRSWPTRPSGANRYLPMPPDTTIIRDVG